MNQIIRSWMHRQARETVTDTGIKKDFRPPYPVGTERETEIPPQI